MEYANISELQQKLIERQNEVSILKELKKITDEKKALIKSIHETNASIEMKEDATNGPIVSSTPPTQSTNVTPEIRIQSAQVDTNPHRNDPTRICNIPRNEKLYYNNDYYIMVDDEGNPKLFIERPGQEDNELHITTQQNCFSIPCIHGGKIQVTNRQIHKAIKKEGVIRIQANKVHSNCKPNYEFILQPNNKDTECINNNKNYIRRNTAGYQTVSINKKTKLLHRIISEIYIKYNNININRILGKNKYQVDHINNDPYNNNVNNLRIVTPAQNMANRRPTHHV